MCCLFSSRGKTQSHSSIRPSLPWSLPQAKLGEHVDDISSAIDESASPTDQPMEALTANAFPTTEADPIRPTEQDAARPRYVYAIGRVRPQFSSLAVEKEFSQRLSMADTNGLTDSEALHAVVSDRANRYLARQMCWSMAIEGMEMYQLVPRDSADLDFLIEAVRPRPSEADIDVAVGVLGGLAPANLCNGMQLPWVVFEQLYSFKRDELLATIPRPSSQKDKDQFEASSNELFDRIMQLADNLGATDEHRALNYLAVRCPDIYALAAEAFAAGASLSSIETQLSRLSSHRRIVKVIFSFTNRKTGYTEKSSVRVDATEMNLFVVTKLGPYYDR